MKINKENYKKSYTHSKSKAYKLPTRQQWNKLLNQMPTEDVGLNKDGSYNTKNTPDFRKWLKEG